jgi:hypothetical protein
MTMGKRTAWLSRTRSMIGKLLPVGQDQHRVGVFGRFVDAGRSAFLRGRQHFLGALHGGRIVGRDGCAGFEQLLDHVDGGRLANIVGVALEGQAEGRQRLPRRVHSAESTLLKKMSFWVSLILRTSCSSWKSTPCCCATQ